MELQIAIVSHVCRACFTGGIATLIYLAINNLDVLSHLSHATYRERRDSIYLSTSLLAGCDMRQCDIFRDTDFNRN